MIEQTKNVLDKIPSIIEGIRNVIMKLLSMLNLPIDSTYPLVVGIIALFFSYIWIKQFVSSGFLKLSVLLNLILMSLLIYVIFIYV